MTTRVRWLKAGKRQTDRFGKWERVEEGQVSDWDPKELERYNTPTCPGFYELVKDEPEPASVPTVGDFEPAAGDGGDDVSEPGSGDPVAPEGEDSSPEVSTDPEPSPKEKASANKKARKGKRRQIKKE